MKQTNSKHYKLLQHVNWSKWPQAVITFIYEECAVSGREPTHK